MLRYFLTITFVFMTAVIYCQDTLVIEDSSYNSPLAFYNEVGLGPLIMIPAGIYKSHDDRIQPGISLSYVRNIGSGSSINQYLGVEVNWIDLGTASQDIRETGPGGIYEYTSIADIEYASFSLIYRLQPDLAFWVWPYLEVGIGPACFYTNDRERFSSNDEDEVDETYDLVKIDWTVTNRFGFGIQYVFYNINAYLDLSWRFSFHKRSEYDTIDKDDVPPNSRPVEYLETRVSRASNQLIKLSFNYMF